MSTRSLIGMKNADGSVNAVYCHYDGYPAHNGVILINFYNTTEKVKELISLGSLSALRTRIAPSDGETHTFNNPLDDVVIAYHRDRGEEYCPPAHFRDVDRIIERADNFGAEYIYIWDGNSWDCYDVYNKIWLKINVSK